MLLFDFLYSLNKSLVFTKDENFVYAPELQALLEKNGCKIITSQLMFLQPNEVTEHYPHMKNEKFFPQIQEQYREYPVYVFLVRGRFKTIKKIVGEFTDPTKCALGSFRKMHGKDKGHNAAHRTGSFKERFVEFRRWFGRHGFVTRYRMDSQRWQDDLERIVKLVARLENCH